VEETTMKIEFTLIDDDGKSYQGTAELKTIATQAAANQARRVPPLGQEAKGLPEHILALREASFFREPRTPEEVHTKLLETYHCLLNRVRMALLRLQRRRELRKAVKQIGEQEHVAFVW
jgi:hypothetical protein